MSPAYVGGSSGGHSFSLLMAHRYPQDVKALILCHPGSDDVDLLKPPADAHYFELAEVAEAEGMKAVIEHSTQAWRRLGSSNPERWDTFRNWVAETIARNPSNLNRLLSMDAKAFAAIMKKWGDWFLSGRIHLSGLTDEEVGRIKTPALVVHGFDEYHPEHTARELNVLLPNSYWVDFSDRYSKEEIAHVRESDAISAKVALNIPYYEEFLKKNEAK